MREEEEEEEEEEDGGRKKKASPPLLTGEIYRVKLEHRVTQGGPACPTFVTR